MKKSIQKALLSLIFLASLCIIGTPVHAEDGDTFIVPIENDEGTAFDITFKVISETDKTVQLGTGGPGAENRSFQGGLTLSDPVSYKGAAYTVVEIADNAFDNNGYITSLKGDNITTVGQFALNGSALTTVDLPDATIIGSNAFSNSSALSTIDLPNVTTVGAGAFYRCIALKTVELPQAKTIGDNAFLECTVLTTVNLPQATTIGESAFTRCIALTTIELPQATTIGNNAFSGCSALTTMTLPLATTIEREAFRGCTALATIDLPQAATIGEFAFSECTAMKTIDLPQATAIGNNAFDECTALTTIDLPLATTFGDYVFWSCTALTTVNLPQATTIGEGTFSVCNALTTINLPQATTIGKDAFFGCLALTTINLPQATTIGVDAFNICDALTTMVLGIKDGGYSFADIGNYPQYIYLPQGSTVTDLAFGGINYVADGKGEIKTYALNVTEPSKIESRPGAKAEFTVNADIQSDIDDTFLSKELAYQWQKKTNQTWTNLEGETGKTLTFAALTAEQLGTYRCQIKPVNYPVLAADSSEADVTIMLFSPDVAASTITGIEEGKAYLKGETLTFTVNGAGMDNNNPYEGDTRYIPVDWEVNPSGTFTDSYTVTVDTKDMVIGKHKLQVSFDKQKFSSGQWTKAGAEIYTKSVNFTLENKLIPPTTEKTTPTTEKITPSTEKTTPKTGDTNNAMLLGLVMALSLCAAVLVQKVKNEKLCKKG